MRTLAYTVLALVAFAANSILCRIALVRPAIDPATFSTLRLTSGAATLLLITARQGLAWRAASSWRSAGILVLYAVPFAFAYVGLSAATGALILFGTVQATMLIAAVRQGERPDPMQWSGLGLALAGLVYLMLPGVSAPPPAPATLMVIAGIGWGLYSLAGRTSAENPLARTTGNFVRAVPMVCAINVVALPQFHAELQGMWLAVASGSLASGVGYAIWYAALRGLTATRAAIVQIAVPLIAALGGVFLLGEGVTLRLMVATVLIAGGIGLTTPSKGD
jgi:drug/metabolite transporter (DMT)-like permease